ncbi:MAG: hypothetical protein JG766_295, partial [Desulfacinum sp.]|nr:hypothetical protein [Desulfacinum sp.]
DELLPRDDPTEIEEFAEPKGPLRHSAGPERGGVGTVRRPPRVERGGTGPRSLARRGAGGLANLVLRGSQQANQARRSVTGQEPIQKVVGVLDLEKGLMGKGGRCAILLTEPVGMGVQGAAAKGLLDPGGVNTSQEGRVPSRMRAEENGAGSKDFFSGGHQLQGPMPPL